MKRKSLYFLLLLASLGLAACGGGGSDDDKEPGGYNGATGAANLSAGNGDDLTLAAVSGVRAALADSSLPSVLSISSRRAAGIDWPSLAARTANEPVNDLCSSGTADVTSSTDDDGTVTVIYQFDNCTITKYGETATIDGRVVTVTNPGGSFSLTFENVTVSGIWGSETYVYYAMACEAEAGCRRTIEVQGVDGRVYRVEYGDTVYVLGGSSEVTGDLTVYHPDYGSVNVSIDNPLLFDCAAGMPSGGSLTLTDGNGDTATVTFNDCDSFTVTIDGVSETYQWADLLNG